MTTVLVPNPNRAALRVRGEQAQLLTVVHSGLRRGAPSARDKIVPTVRGALAQPYGRRHWAEFSAVPGMAIGSFSSPDGASRSTATVQITIPVTAAGTWGISATIANGTAAGLITARRIACTDPAVSGATTAANALGVAGEVYSGTATLTGTEGHWGLQVVVALPGSGNAYCVLKALTITRPDTSTYTLTTDDLINAAFVSPGYAGASVTSRYQSFASGAALRSVGIMSGRTHRTLWVDPAADVFPGGSFMARTIVGDETAGLLPINAVWLAQCYHLAGFETPVIICRPGDYTCKGSNIAVWDVGVNTSELFIAAPFGEARWNKGASVTHTRLVRSDPAKPFTLNLWAISTGSADDLTNPIVYAGGTLNALDCYAEAGTGSTADVWNLTDCDFLLEGCSAIGNATNRDGFNHHGKGHGRLVRCTAMFNADDGFSPHDNCTFEVWYGNYASNGKGNIIPAFGAQGFSVGVMSDDSMGTSPLISGLNHGGFVALSLDTDTRFTSMICVDCQSDGDTIGFNSAGKKSFLLVCESKALNAIIAGIRNGAWQSGTSAGRLMVADMAYSGNAANDAIGDATRFQALAVGA